jgi:uncharacterized protein YcfL
MKNPIFPLLGLLVVTLAGCTTPGGVNTVGSATPTPAFIQDRRVVTDPYLASDIRVLGIRQTRVSGDLLKIEIVLLNTTGSDRQIHYKVEWQDNAGMTIASPTGGWRVAELKSEEQTAIAAIAISPSATDFTIKLQE